MPAPGRMKGYRKPIPLQPGSAIGIQLVSGDMDMAAFGTVTYRRGNQISPSDTRSIADRPDQFPDDHGLRPRDLPGLPLALVSPPGQAGGRDGAGSALLGRRPPRPAAADDPPHLHAWTTAARAASGIFHAQVVNHPLLAPMLIPAAVDEAIYEVAPGARATPPPRCAPRSSTEGFGTITPREPGVRSRGDRHGIAGRPSQGVDVLSRNRFQRIPDQGPERPRDHRGEAAAQPPIERIFVRQEKFEPGETVEVGVVLRPYRGEPFTTKAQIKVPEYAVNGRAVLMVSGGPARSASPGVSLSAAPAAARRRAFRRHAECHLRARSSCSSTLEREKNNQLVTRIVFAARR